MDATLKLGCGKWSSRVAPATTMALASTEEKYATGANTCWGTTIRCLRKFAVFPSCLMFPIYSGRGRDVI